MSQRGNSTRRIMRVRERTREKGSGMIKYRSLTKEEQQSGTHFCGRCESWQKRFELHHCTPTERWKAAKAAMWAQNPMPPPRQAPPANSTVEPANRTANTEAVSSESVSSPVEEEHFFAANSDDFVSSEDAPVSSDRKAYMRDLMRRKRAAARETSSD